MPVFFALVFMWERNSLRDGVDFFERESIMPTISMFFGIPPKQLKMVQAWIEIHKDELFADWELAVAGEQPFRIAPLQ